MKRVSSKGFTIFELMFVLVIFAILFAMAAPRFVAGDEQTALQTTANNMARLASYARQSAISKDKAVTITIHPEERVWYMDLPLDEDDRRYRKYKREIDVEDRIPGSDEEMTNELHSRLEIQEVLINGEEVNEDRIVIKFNPNGTATNATIILKTKKKGDLMTVEIEGATGRVSAYDGEPKQFADILEEAGLDYSKFAGVSPTEKAEDEKVRLGKGFSMTAGGSEERSAAYRDAAARIMGRTTQRFEREQEAENDPSSPRIGERGPIQ